MNQYNTCFREEFAEKIYSGIKKIEDIVNNPKPYLTKGLISNDFFVLESQRIVPEEHRFYFHMNNVTGLIETQFKKISGNFIFSKFAEPFESIDYKLSKAYLSLIGEKDNIIFVKKRLVNEIFLFNKEDIDRLKDLSINGWDI
jgi:hypothetical protein